MLNKYPIKDKKIYPIGANAEQGEAIYRGTDQWSYKILPVGTMLAQLDFPKRINGNTETASQFFTTLDEANKHRDPRTGKIDTAALSERLQVMAHKSAPNADFKHSALVTIYEVKEPMPVAFAKVTDNPALGAGGADQFYSVDNRKNLILRDVKPIGVEPDAKTPSKIGYLKSAGQIQASNQEVRLPLYRNIEEHLNGGPINRDKIGQVVGRHHRAYKSALLLSGDKTAINIASSMNKREAFSVAIRPPFHARDWQALKDAVLPAQMAHNGQLNSNTTRTVGNIRNALLNADVSEVQSIKVTTPTKLMEFLENAPKIENKDWIVPPIKSSLFNNVDLKPLIKEDEQFRSLKSDLDGAITNIYSNPKAATSKAVDHCLDEEISPKGIRELFSKNPSALGKLAPKRLYSLEGELFEKVLKENPMQVAEIEAFTAAIQERFGEHHMIFGNLRKNLTDEQQTHLSVLDNNKSQIKLAQIVSDRIEYRSPTLVIQPELKL